MFGYRPPNISHSYNARPCTKFRLFAAARVTAMALPAFAEFLRNQRLALAYRILTDTRFAERSISSIAYETGFGDLSNFNHYFRRRYAATPSEIRKVR